MTEKKAPVPKPDTQDLPEQKSSSGAIDAFLRQARAMAVATPANGEGTGKLILALDATMSRQPTWDLACKLQGEMFDAVSKAGALNVQLVYFRGFGECRASRFVRDTGALKTLMTKIDCRGGHTQISKVLSHALKETSRQKVNALVYIGDAMEESVDSLADKAGRLGLAGVPVFVFQEGTDPIAERAFREIATLSKGAWFRLDSSAAAHLGKLLSAVAVYATGGFKALTERNRPEDRLMLEHLRGNKGR